MCIKNLLIYGGSGAQYQEQELTKTSNKTELCPIGVYFNFAKHSREPYRKMGRFSKILIGSTGKIEQTKFILFDASRLLADKTGEEAHEPSDAILLVG